MRCPLLSKAIMILVGLVIGFFLSEMVLRLTEKREAVKYVQRDEYYVYPPSKTIPAKNEDNEDVILRTDEFGLRNEKNSLSKAEVIVLGDSCVAAVNTPDDASLAGRMRAKGLRVYNAGMDGFGTAQEFLLLRDLLMTAHPRVVILGFYLGNDFRDNYFSKVPDADTGRGAAPASLPGLASRLKNILKSSRIVRFIQQKFVFPARGRKEILLSYPLSEMESYRLTYDGPMAEAAEQTKQALGRIADVLKEKGISFIVMGIPSKAQVSRSFYEISQFDEDKRSKSYALGVIHKGFSFDRPDAVLSEIVRALGIFYVSLLPIFRTCAASELYFKIDHHWNAKGQEVAAEAVLKALPAGSI